MWRSSGFAWGVLALLIAAPAEAQLDRNARSKYESVIAKGRDRLLAMSKNAGTGEAALVGYALIKSGVEKTHPKIQGQAAATAERVNRGTYQSAPETQNHIYEASCEAMLLAEVDPQAFRPQLEILRDYLVRKQLPNGAWCYPTQAMGSGDMSVTQFALLGLWATRRAGLEVPTPSWDKCASWLIAVQRKDGGFCYRPHETTPPEIASVTTHTMTAAGLGSMLVIKRNLFLLDPLSEGDTAAAGSAKRFGVLEQLPAERGQAARAPRPGGEITVKQEDLNDAIRQSTAWMASHYEAVPTPRRPLQYFHYTCERAGALLNTETFGSHRWYEEGAKLLTMRQSPSGEWVDEASPVSPPAATAFALLFLSRATHSIVTPPPPKVRLHGGGLLGGGRGLPDDLSKVDVRDGTVKQRAAKAPIDTLLSELERPTTVVDEGAQAAVVEAIQLEQRDQLVGQIDRLRKLVRDARPEVRQVAVWALGRSDDLRQAPLLIAALGDPSLDVAVEASLSLCVLSRRPEGVRAAGGKGDLIAIEPPVAPEDEDADAQAKRAKPWQTAAQQAWHDWYLQVRPYDERDDRQQLRSK